MSNIFVCVRCRPLNSREKTRGAVGLIRMSGNQTIIDRPPPSKDEKTAMSKDDNQPKTFAFDRSYWSACPPTDPDYASQQIVFNDIGVSLLNNAFDGYNACIFAYGQTGSGKSYSMVGYGEDRGIIPLTCVELFERIDGNTDVNLTYNVEVSYMEIYCERVRDLLNPKNKGNLRVREHPSLGPYVEDLSKMVVKSYKDIEDLMDEGNKARTVASTNMNATSSRSHAVFTIILTQVRFDPDAQLNTEKVSRVSLVDLAGSERANSTGASGQRLKEGANINKSLTTLGKVISALADQAVAAAAGKKGKKKEDVFVLTWLLKDSLGGNSRTIMLAAISPADYEETLSTLRYADRAKRIVNKAVVNEDPNAKLVRELKEELDLLRSKLAVYNPEEAYASVSGKSSSLNSSSGANKILHRPTLSTQSAIELQDQLQASEKLMSELNETWEEKLAKTHTIQAEREKALEDLGITIEKNDVGVHSPKRTPHLVNLNEDPLMSECLIYSLKLGTTRVGLVDSNVEVEIRLSGASILPEHCYFENVNSVVTIHPYPGSMTLVNGRVVTEAKRLRSGYRIILGDNHVFRFTNPEEVRRERTKSRLSMSVTSAEIAEMRDPRTTPPERSESRASTSASDIVDWNYAWKEVSLGVGTDVLSNDGSEVYPRHMRTSTNGSIDPNYSQMQYSPDKMDLELKLKASQAEMERALIEQRKQYEETFQKLVESKNSKDVVIPRVYTEREKRLIDRVLKCLKKRTFVGMAETVLTNAVLLKEVNVISRELKKDVTYQFIVIDSLTNAISSSYWESLSFDELDSTEDQAMIDSKVPCIGVQVIDKCNVSHYVWSLDKLKHKLHRMRNLYNLVDRPMYKEHFNLEDPFFEKPTPQFVLVGTGVVSIHNLWWNVAQTFTVPILNHLDAKVEARLKVKVTPITFTSINNSTNVKPSNHFKVGDQVVFEVQIEELFGLNEARFTQAHVQFRLSSFGHVPSLSSGDKVYATDPTSDFGTESIRYNFRHTFAINVTEQFLSTIQSQPLRFEVFGKPSLKVLQQYEQHESVDMQNQLNPSHATLIGAPENIPASGRERRSEEELVQRETHDVLVWIQITELAASGEYENAPVQANGPNDLGCFLLRQGLQRRIQVHMTHNSGRQFPLSNVPKVLLGRVRLVDNKGRYANETNSAPVALNVIPSSVQSELFGDGTGALKFTTAWDSSLHDSIHLNRNTASGQKVVLTLNWQVESERLHDPLTFTSDLPVTITSRTGSVSKSLFAFMSNSTRQLSKLSTMYQVTLRPRMASKRTDLWRLNTASTYVRGEEFLGSWRPRGVSLILDSRKVSQRISKVEAVELTRQGLDLLALTNRNISPPPTNDSNQLLTKYLNLWKSSIVHKDDIDKVTTLENEVGATTSNLNLLTEVVGEEIKLEILRDGPGTQSPDSAIIGSDRTTNSSTLAELNPSNSALNLDLTAATRHTPTSTDNIRKMIGEVKQVLKSDKVARQGYLFVPDNVDNWVKRWVVIRKPYIYMYSTNYEVEELGVFDLSTVRVDYNTDMENLLQRNYVFALYTSTNAYMFQATSYEDMKSWLKVIDQWYILKA